MTMPVSKFTSEYPVDWLSSEEREGNREAFMML
jgi:hypothetical protein